jgi:nitrite reductase/ring-hydroxylating ferredoxin subunit/uncharacterized membrane protein
VVARTPVPDRVLSQIEKAAWLDRIADVASAALHTVIRPGLVKDVLSGTPVGHPVHPLLVTLPIGSWVSATYLDVAGGAKSRTAARRLVAFGAVMAVPAAITGASDWSDTSGAERRVGLVHSAANYTALSLYCGSWLARRRRRQAVGVALAAVGGTILTASGWLGGHLTYALGVGVDTTAFQQLPTEWTDVAAESAVTTEPRLVDAAGVPVLLMRDDGQIVALDDRCTHRGGPLHEGAVEAGCVTCPWHGSQFRLTDGSVVRGPATRPAPTFEVRVAGGRVQVRASDEQRALRRNPIGV